MEMTDDDLELVAQYIAHEMTPAAEHAFERKLTDDAQFHARVFPFLDVWYDTEVWPTEPVAEPLEPVRPVTPVTPINRVTRIRFWWMGGTGSLLTAAGIAFAMVMRSGIAPVASPLVTHRDDPRSPVTGVQTTPVTAAHKAPETLTHVVAQSDKTFRAAKRALDSATTKMVAASTDSTAQRVLAEVDRLGEPEVQFTPPQVGVVAGAQPIAPKVPFQVLVLADTEGVSTKQQINDLLHPQGAPTNVGDPAGNQSWWRRLFGKLRGGKKTVPLRGIDE
jgi:hypothetical protein